jgi:glycosyltransferase involved in cell wall biosynthesis
MAVCVVGAGRRFLSGPAYYTHALSNALSTRFETSLVTMRQLLPTRLYPGRARVGAPLSSIEYEPDVAVFDGVDWYWGSTMARAAGFLRSRRPDVVVFQWWTATVLHSYLALALVARALGARVVIEFHETLDTGEARLGPVRAYARSAAPALMRLASGYVVHSSHDVPALRAAYGLGNKPVSVIPMGPFDRRRTARAEPGRADLMAQAGSSGPMEVLFFGLIRPYKGVETLVEAWDRLPVEVAAALHLTIVGEVWEGWTAPGDAVRRSRYRESITFVDRYVSDDEVERFFAAADAVCLPYRRSSGSGALVMAMNHGLPVITTNVPALVETVAGYAGALVVPVDDAAALSRALCDVRALRGRRFADPHPWGHSLDAFEELFATIGAARQKPQGASGALRGPADP